MNFADHQQQQQYMMAQGPRMQNPRMVNMPSNAPHTMQRQPRYGMPVLQPNQQPMSMPSQYVSPQMALRQINEMVSRLPPEMQQIAQQQLNSEPNVELKKQIAEGYLRNNQMRMTSLYSSQGPQSMMVNMSPTQKVGMASGNMGANSMARMGVPQSVAMSQGVFPNQNSPGIGTVNQPQVSIQRSSAHGFMTGNMQIQNFTTQEPTSSASVLPNYNSPQPSIIQQPSSVRPAIQQNICLPQRGPNSVPCVIYGQNHPQGSSETNVPSQPPPNQEEEKVSAADKAVYEKKLADLKVHHEQIKRLKERQTVDGVRTKAVYERLLELIEGRRTVKIDLLVKLADSVHNLIERNSPLYSLTELLKTMPSDLSSTFALPDPWGELKQFSIKPPDFANKENETSLKRPATPIESHAVKRIKKDGASLGLPQIKMELLDEPPSLSCKEEYRYEDSYDNRGFDIRDGFFAVRCKNGTRLDLSTEIPTQLRNTRYRIDSDLAPISNECNEVQILVENDILLVPPLRIVIPINYPESGAAVWSDPRITEDPTLADLNAQFDKRLVMTQNTNSIPQILHAWKIASEYVYKSNVTARRSKRI